MLEILPAFRFGDELGRALGQLLHRAVEGGAVGGRHHFGQPLGEFERARRQFLVDRAAGRRQRQEDFAQVGAVGPAGEELALLELRHRARDLGLVHVGAGRRPPCRSSRRSRPG